MKRDKRLDAATKRLAELRANQHRVYPQPSQNPGKRHMQDIKILLVMLVVLVVLAAFVGLGLLHDGVERTLDRGVQQVRDTS